MTLEHCTHAQLFSRVQLFVTLWTVAHQAPLSMGFSRQQYWSGLPLPPPGDLPNPGTEPASLVSLQLNHPGSPIPLTKIQAGLIQISLVFGFALFGGGGTFMKCLWNFITGTNMYTNQLFHHQKEAPRAFPGGPVVKTVSVDCRGCGFDPWLGN